MLCREPWIYVYERKKHKGGEILSDCMLKDGYLFFNICYNVAATYRRMMRIPFISFVY